MEEQTVPRLAVLIGAPHTGDTSMHDDLIAMHAALRARGFANHEILSLEGKLERRLLLGFLKEVGRRVSAWTTGELFVYVTGHGGFTGETVDDARLYVMLEDQDPLSDEGQMSWDDILASLAVPVGVNLTLLPDH